MQQKLFASLPFFCDFYLLIFDIRREYFKRWNVHVLNGTGGSGTGSATTVHPSNDIFVSDARRVANRTDLDHSASREGRNSKWAWRLFLSLSKLMAFPLYYR